MSINMKVQKINRFIQRKERICLMFEFQKETHKANYVEQKDILPITGTFITAHGHISQIIKLTCLTCR